jgi:uncharacterized small protein (DUF1192 family)
MIEEETPRPAANRFAPAVLDRWDVAELQRYIGALRAEIARAEAAIAARQAHRSAADAFFRKP